MRYRALNELLCAALINRRFQEAFLKDPAQAVANGYEGYYFKLTPEEFHLVKNIRAATIEDFADQLVGRMQSVHLDSRLRSQYVESGLCQASLPV